MATEVEFFPQEPNQAPFTGEFFLERLNSANVRRCKFAVAWVRSGGVKALRSGIQALLAREGTAIEIVVGVDIANTSLEGLALLLELKDLPGGDRLRLDVYHEEGPRSTFHPKVYIFDEAGGRSTVVVGSSNMTAAAMNQNVEANMVFRGPTTHALVVAADESFTRWQDRKAYAKELTSALLEKLVAEGYVFTEARLRIRAAGMQPPKKRTSLFKRRPGPKKPPAGAGAPPPPGELDRAAVLVRVRTARGTQTQLPFGLLEDPFFDGVTELIAPDGTPRGISEAHARGGVNTRKVEIPESKGIKEPILLLTKDPAGKVYYQCADAQEPFGASLKRVLQAGLVADPPQTVNTRPAEPERGTWYRVL